MTRTDVTADETRNRIIEATVATLKAEGITGTSARAIARHGSFNQALIFYHFGSIEEVLIATIYATSEQRIQRYRDRLADIHTLPELAAVAADLHAEDLAQGNLTVLTQLMTGAAGNPEMGARLRDAFDPWIEVVRETLERVTTGTPFAGLVPIDDAAYGVAALFLGIELLTHLDPSRRQDTLYETIQSAAQLVQALLAPDDKPVTATRPHRIPVE
jgi:AcrR family transcriptional regulator